MEIASLILLILGIVNLFLGLIIFLKNRRNLINILYGLLALSVTVWCFAIYFFRISVDVTLFWSRIAYLSAAAIAFFFLYFTLYFPFKIKINYLGHLFFIIYFLILIGLIIGTEEVLKSYMMVNNTHGILFGKAYILYSLFIFVFFGLGFLILILKYLKSTGITKLQIRYVLMGGLLTAIIATITNLVLFGIGVFKYNWMGPSSTIFLVSFLALAITRYHLFEIRVILTELLVGVIGLLLLVQAMTAEGFTWQIFGLGLFVLFCVFGYLLIKSVMLEIQRRQEIEKIDKAKSEFISIASHQLRTPLTAVKGYISMILEGTYGQLAEKQARPLENVYQSNERLIRLVNDLLNLSRLDAGKIEFSPELTSLEEMVSGVVEELRINAEKKGLYMKMIKPSESLPKIMADQDKLRQVILNIVDNAIKYTKEGGITFELKKLNEQEEIKVFDTGEGMDEGELNSLFQMFSRATAGTQLHAEGAGLGLYVARQFIEMHGGKIWAESPGKGKGSTFIIQLPLKK